ncbi:MAG: porin family protein [Bacteroidota bacterium]
MRVRFLFTIFLLLMGGPKLCGQSSLDGLEFGLKAGIHRSQISGDVSTFFSSRFAAGGFVQFQTQEAFDLRLEVLLSQSGANDASRREKNGRWEYTYATIPLTFVFPTKKNSKLSFEAGIQHQLLIEAMYKDSEGIFDIISETRNWDFGALVGLMYQIDSNWFIQFRIYQAFFNHSLRTWTGDRYYNQDIQLQVGYKIKAKK